MSIYESSPLIAFIIVILVYVFWPDKKKNEGGIEKERAQRLSVAQAMKDQKERELIMARSLREEAAALIKEAVGHEFLYFDRPLTVEYRGRKVTAWGVCVSPDGQPYFFDDSDEWTKAEEVGTLRPICNRTRTIVNRYKPK